MWKARGSKACREYEAADGMFAARSAATVSPCPAARAAGKI